MSNHGNYFATKAILYGLQKSTSKIVEVIVIMVQLPDIFDQMNDRSILCFFEEGDCYLIRIKTVSHMEAILEDGRVI